MVDDSDKYKVNGHLDFWGEGDNLIKNPDDKLRSTMDFHRTRIAINQGHYKVAQNYLKNEWLQRGFFEAAFLNGMISAANPESNENDYLEGIRQMLEGCYSYFTEQLLYDLKSALEHGVARGIIREPGVAEPVDPENLALETLMADVHGMVRNAKDPLQKDKYAEKLSELLSELRKLLA